MPLRRGQVGDYVFDMRLGQRNVAIDGAENPYEIGLGRYLNDGSFPFFLAGSKFSRLSQKDNFQARFEKKSCRMTFPFKGSPIIFFFSASTERASILPAGESSNDLCLSVTKLSVTNLQKSFSYIISSRGSGLSAIPPCRLPSA